MEKKTIKTGVIVALLTMLGFVSSCNPESGRDMYGSPPANYEKKEAVEKQKVTSDKQTTSDTTAVNDPDSSDQ